MQKGIIKFFNESRGLGFITMQSSENEVFVHISGFIDKVRANDEVVFDVVQGPKGLSAVKVKIA
jgi:cold shock protein